MKLRQTQCCVVFALILHCTIFFNIASRFSESNDIAEELQQDNASRFALPKSSNKPMRAGSREQNSNTHLNTTDSNDLLCACGDVYDISRDRCVQTEPSILLWYGGYGGEHSIEFISTFTGGIASSRISGKKFANAACRAPAAMIESWQFYSYHWLETSKMSELYRTCRNLDEKVRECLRSSEPALVSLRRNNSQKDAVCRSARQLFVAPPQATGHEFNMTLNFDDFKRALLTNKASFHDPVPASWPAFIIQAISSFCPAVHEPGPDLVSVRHLADCCGMHQSLSTASVTNAVKIACMTIAKDEELTLAFTVGALVNHIDLYVVIDTGSRDRSVLTLHRLFPREISAGALVIIETSVGNKVSKARNLALGMARERGCTHVVKMDADDVLYDAGAARLVNTIRSMPADTQLVWVPQWELVQGSWEDSAAWLRAVASDIKRRRREEEEEEEEEAGVLPQQRFYRLTHMAFGHDRVYALTEDLEARGRWDDEYHGRRAESLYHTAPGRFVFLLSHRPLIAHYGWARPLRRLREKTRAWDMGWHGRMPDALTNKTYAPFTHHPEVVARLVDRLAQILDLQV
jgi:hypothetical protein